MRSKNRLNPIDFEISETAIKGFVWGENQPTLTLFHTSSTQPNTTLGSFYYDVYETQPTQQTNDEVKFQIGFGDRRGRGSVKYSQWGGNKTNTYSPSSTIYHQIKSLLNVSGVGYDENLGFLFGDKHSDYFYVINVSRSGYKESLSPNGLTLTLTKNDTTEGWIQLTLTTDVKSPFPLELDSGVGDIYQMVLGDNDNIDTTYNVNGWSSNRGSYGWYIPKLGMIILNGKALDDDYSNGGFELDTDLTFNYEGRNQSKLFSVIQQQWGDITPSPNPLGFTLYSEETLKEKYVYVMIPSTDFNYSNNPTFVSGSEGNIRYEDFYSNPQTYITSVGLYNDNEDLVGVVKLSQPLLKDFTKHLMLRCKIDF